MQTTETLTEQTPAWSYASPIRRLVAFLIDMALLSGCMLIFYILFMTVIPAVYIELYQIFTPSHKLAALGSEKDVYLQAMEISWILIPLIAFMTPIFFSLSRWRATTPGMRIMNCQVIDKDLNFLSAQKALLRSFLRWIPLILQVLTLLIIMQLPINSSNEMLFYISIMWIILCYLIVLLGFVFIFFNKKRQALHDYLAGTYVAYNLPKMPFRKSKNIVTETESV